ncbi:uncharacterized protein [Asterias amurensis]|uniref:uncharacterized protein n=1 Tax=Asterias amurensis TaxID=7602 RepID=UPI003AB5C9C0
MTKPSYLIVLFVVCTTLRSCVVAVRFKTLAELLEYHEQQQNPGSDEEATSTVHPELEGLMLVTSQPPTPQLPSVPAHNHRRHRHHHQDPDQVYGSGAEPTSILSTTTTRLVMETELPTTTRPKTTCCILGEQAGMKRHHCNPDNYMPRFRDYNRRHNFKQSNRHPSIEKSQFDKCTSGIIRRHAEEFRNCCQEAYKMLWQKERGEENVGNGRIHLIEVPI